MSTKINPACFNDSVHWDLPRMRDGELQGLIEAMTERIHNDYYHGVMSSHLTPSQVDAILDKLTDRIVDAQRELDRRKSIG